MSEPRLCSDCPPPQYMTDVTRCGECPRRRRIEIQTVTCRECGCQTTAQANCEFCGERP